jgi:hypothetical protein
MQTYEIRRKTHRSALFFGERTGTQIHVAFSLCVLCSSAPLAPNPTPPPGAHGVWVYKK